MDELIDARDERIEILESRLAGIHDAAERISQVVLFSKINRERMDFILLESMCDEAAGDSLCEKAVPICQLRYRIEALEDSGRSVLIETEVLHELLQSCLEMVEEHQGETASMTRKTMNWLLAISDRNPDQQVGLAVRQMLAEVIRGDPETV